MPAAAESLPAAAARRMRERGLTWTRPCPSLSRCDDRRGAPPCTEATLAPRAHLLYAAHVMLTAAMARPEMMDAWFSFSVLRPHSHTRAQVGHATRHEGRQQAGARTWR